MINVHHKVIVDEIQHAPQEKEKDLKFRQRLRFTLFAIG